MSLYYVQKFLYELNRNDATQVAYAADPHGTVEQFGLAAGVQNLSSQEQQALTEPDIGLLYHLGVNGQILMHFAAFHGIAWADYLERMREGIRTHGPVREGVYAMTTQVGPATQQGDH
ncbi:MAG: aromatic ring-opening dioxygenase subunit LigA [Acidimicrobiales bacterium]|nr:aromatic ring-opening dioxygenase subunit LigA [Acidimicrobiales bacterium]